MTDRDNPPLKPYRAVNSVLSRDQWGVEAADGTASVPAWIGLTERQARRLAEHWNEEKRPMPSDTDLDALMQAYRDLDDEKFHDTIEALRARLAPTTHADDEVAVDNLTYAAESGDHIATRACAEGLRRRLADLRARAEAAEVERKAPQSVTIVQARMHASHIRADEGPI